LYFYVVGCSICVESTNLEASLAMIKQVAVTVWSRSLALWML